MNQPSSEDLFDNLHVASPCSVDWSTMRGDDVKRLCGQCALHVYDITAMSKQEAAAFLAENEEVCLRFYRRGDGTVITRDCPVGVARLRKRVQSVQKYAAGAAAFLFTLLGLASPASKADDAKRNLGKNGETLQQPKAESHANPIHTDNSVKDQTDENALDLAPTHRIRPLMGKRVRRYQAPNDDDSAKQNSDSVKL